jgi:hypothetical protein
MKTYSPLHNFGTREKSFEFSNYLSLKVFHELNYRFDDNDSFISKIEFNDASICHDWLIIDSDKIKLEDEVVLNTLLVAFWIFSPNKVSYKYIFDDDGKCCYKNFSWFEFNEKDINKSEYTLKELSKIKTHFKMLEFITHTNGRLHTAFLNTLQGCMAFNWKTAFILYSAAIEALLTYKRSYGITNRLSKSYACLVEKDILMREQEYCIFSHLYNIRSDIMHGKVYNKNPDDNLLSLSEFAYILRRLWQTILADLNIINNLEQQDADRESFFNKREMA